MRERQREKEKGTELKTEENISITRRPLLSEMPRIGASTP